MAIGRTNVGGSGGGGDKSVLYVNVASGSVVTCTQGSTTKTATAKGGVCKFTGLDLGEWAVVATHNGQTARAKVTFERQEVEYISLSYTLIIFDAGTYAEETGGFSPGNAIADGLLNCVTGTNGTSMVSRTVYTNNLVDLTNFSKLHFTITTSEIGYATSGERIIGISNAADSSNSFVATASNAVGTQTIDLSSIEGEYAIKLYTSCRKNTSGGSWEENRLKVSKIWAE